MILVFNGTTQTWSQPSGVSLEKFIGLSSQKKCFEGVEKQVMEGALYAWTNQVEHNVVHISRDSGLSFHNISIPAISGLHNISIKHIEIHCLVPVATFLLHGTNSENQQKGFFLQYNLAEDAWKKHEVSCCLDPPVSFFFNPPSTQFVFVWNEKSLAFGRVNETGSSFKLKRQENQTEFELDANETIVSVTTGGNGDFVVVSSSRRMFYGRAYLGYLVEIHSGEDISSSWTIMFDMLGSLLLIYIEGFTTSITPELHFMDKGDEIKIWAELIYQRSTPNHIKLEISNSDMLQISTEDSIQHYHGIVTQNMTFTFKYELRNGTSNLKGPYKSASLSIQLNPAVVELTCQNNNQVENQDGAVPCHLTAAMDENFKLIVDLYEGGRFVQEVHDDYIVQEETGRIDFGLDVYKKLKDGQKWQSISLET
ncbi:hypothetical protein P5673_028436 [Acropora cervicornis]|uniref:Uncharacterized protein n=1 Tax=Acropora cervicornis TaxID=6130 RepID=A0AAD9PXP2_ACRCE|nr:hypothetical protein P5673_028436 [Acropora cervicornis]